MDQLPLPLRYTVAFATIFGGFYPFLKDMVLLVVARRRKVPQQGEPQSEQSVSFRAPASSGTPLQSSSSPLPSSSPPPSSSPTPSSSPLPEQAAPVDRPAKKGESPERNRKPYQHQESPGRGGPSGPRIGH